MCSRLYGQKTRSGPFPYVFVHFHMFSQKSVFVSFPLLFFPYTFLFSARFCVLRTVFRRHRLGGVPLNDGRGPHYFESGGVVPGTWRRSPPVFSTNVRHSRPCTPNPNLVVLSLGRLLGNTDPIRFSHLVRSRTTPPQYMHYAARMGPWAVPCPGGSLRPCWGGRTGSTCPSRLSCCTRATGPTYL